MSGPVEAGPAPAAGLRVVIERRPSSRVPGREDLAIRLSNTGAVS